MENHLRDHLRSLEEALLTSATRKNAAQVAALLAEEFREYGSSGRSYFKTEMLACLQAELPAQLSLTDFEVSPLSATIALVTYRAQKLMPGSPPAESLRSSLWILREDRWQMLFHQGTTMPATRNPG